jgi:GT2 family glycosyltransferase
MRSPPKVLIVILNRNQYELTRETLRSLQKIDYKNYNILLIDNGSTDDSFHRIKVDFPQLLTMANKKNLGVAGGRNVGIEFARKRDDDYLLFLDNDILVAPDFLTVLVQAMDFYPDVGGVQSLIFHLREPETVSHAGGRFFSLICHNRSRRGKRTAELLRDGHPLEIDWMSGVSQLIKREVFSRVRGFDEDYYPYGSEDQQMGRAIKGAGYRLLVAPRSWVWHREKQEKRWLEFKTENIAMTAVIFLRKNSNRANFPIALAWHLLNYVARYCLVFLYSERYDLLRALVKGLRKGWRKPISSMRGGLKSLP